MKKLFILFAVFCLSQAGSVKADTDLSVYDNVIYVEPATVSLSDDGAEVTLSICMNNTAAIRGFQFDMYLPTGVTAMKTPKGKYVVSLTAARLSDDDEHTLTVAEQTDGAIRFLCGSQYDETFTGTSGEIATIKVKIEGLTDGEYPIALKNMKLTETDISKFYEAAEVVTTLTIQTATGIDALLVNGERVNNVYDLQGRKVNSQLSVFNSQLKKGLYIMDGKKVRVK